MQSIVEKTIQALKEKSLPGNNVYFVIFYTEKSKSVVIDRSLGCLMFDIVGPFNKNIDEQFKNVLLIVDEFSPHFGGYNIQKVNGMIPPELKVLHDADALRLHYINK